MVNEVILHFSGSVQGGAILSLETEESLETKKASNCQDRGRYCIIQNSKTFYN